jgi:hypothetical protein
VLSRYVDADAEKRTEVAPFILYSFYPFLLRCAAARDFEFTKLGTHREEKIDAPVVLVKWYDFVKWLLERVDSFPKNQRFIFGQRLADRSIRVLEILVDAAYRSRKAELLAEANRQIEMLRWLVRLAKDRGLFSLRQYGFACQGLTECGRMVGGWLKQAAAKEGTAHAPASAPF